MALACSSVREKSFQLKTSFLEALVSSVFTSGFEDVSKFIDFNSTDVLLQSTSGPIKPKKKKCRYVSCTSFFRLRFFQRPLRPETKLDRVTTNIALSSRDFSCINHRASDDPLAKVFLQDSHLFLYAAGRCWKSFLENKIKVAFGSRNNILLPFPKSPPKSPSHLF